MPRYKVEAKFGPWERGEEFESEDPFHAKLASHGRLLRAVDAPSAESLVGVPAPWSGAGQEAGLGGPPDGGSQEPEGED